MDKRDISAMVNTLEPVLKRLKGNTDAADRAITFMALKMILSDLEEAAQSMPASGNIIGVLGEIKEHSRGLAGLYPSYDRAENDHYQFALNSIEKLSMPTVFDL